MGKYIIGYELGRNHVQISYQRIGDKEPQTVSLVAGQEQYNIPFVLYKQEEKDLWYIGKEALAKQIELETKAKKIIEEVVLPEAKKGMMSVEICLDASEVEVLSILRKQGYNTRYKTFIGGKEIYVIDWND